MISIRSQVAAFRRNSSESENSDQGENQTISSQNSFSGESSGQDLTFEDENQSSQNLLSQNFLFASTVRPFIKSKSLLKDEMSEFNSHLTKATKISSLNESSD
jgi:hypothetical protein